MGAQKYFFKPEHDELVRSAYREMADVKKWSKAITDAARRIGVERGAVKRRAKMLGITLKRKPWAQVEIDYLHEHAGEIPVSSMARYLGRDREAVISMLDSRHISYRNRRGYSQRDLEFVFGVDHRLIARWTERGWLTLGQDGRYGEAVVLRFLQKHPEQYDLRRVDQPTFKGLLFPRASCFLIGHPKSVQASAANDEEGVA